MTHGSHTAAKILCSKHIDNEQDATGLSRGQALKQREDFIDLCI